MSISLQLGIIIVSIVLMIIPIATSASLKNKEKKEFLKDFIGLQ